MACISKLHYVIGVIIIIILTFWNCPQIILLKCVLEKITILLCVSNRDWKGKKSSMFIQPINIQFIWCLKSALMNFQKWRHFHRRHFSSYLSHLRDGGLNFNWLNHHFNLPWHLHRYDRNQRTTEACAAEWIWFHSHLWRCTEKLWSKRHRTVLLEGHGKWINRSIIRSALDLSVQTGRTSHMFNDYSRYFYFIILLFCLIIQNTVKI